MKNKNILFISSYSENNSLTKLFKKLEDAGCAFYFLSTNKKQIQTTKWRANKIFLGKNLENKKSPLFFIFISPFLFSINLIRLLYLKNKEKIRTIILTDVNEKIIFTPLAKLLKIKIIWLELPNKKTPKSSFVNFLLKKLAKKIQVVFFHTPSQNQIKHIKDNYHILPLGLQENNNKHQDDIFLKIAKQNQENSNKKYFTIGTICALDEKNQIEDLLNSIKICLDVIKNIQLIVVGDGENKKKFKWVSKKLGIENITWFIGEQQNIKKWLDSFDVFVSSNENIKLNKFEETIKVMSSSIPVVGFYDEGLHDLIINDETGYLINKNNPEELSQTIIDLHNNKLKMYKIGKNASEHINNNFNLDNIINKWLEII